MPHSSYPPQYAAQAGEASKEARLSDPHTLGEQTTYEGLVVAILDEGQDTYRIQIVDGPAEFSSSCAGYTPSGIRERALELAYSYLLKRDGTAAKPAATLVWRPIQV